jgi:hypothetical protein
MRHDVMSLQTAIAPPAASRSVIVFVGSFALMAAWSLTTALAQDPPAGGAAVDPPAEVGNPPAAIPGGGLPPDFRALPAIPEQFQVDVPLLTEEEVASLKKSLGKYKTALRGRDLSETTKQDVRNGLRYRLYLMTLKENRRQLADLREDLTLTDLRQAGSLAANVQQMRDFRRFVLQEVVTLARPLLENNFHVRIQAATLLGELDVSEKDDAKSIPQESFLPAAELCAEILKDPNQHVAVKISAARSASRLLRFATVPTPVEVKHKVALPAVAELKDVSQHWWYQMRLCELLSVIDAPFDLTTREPFVANVLRSVLNDPQRHWLVRAEAARALGRVTLDAQTNATDLVREIVVFADQMATAAAPDLKKGQSRMWGRAFFNVYLAFRPFDAEDKDAARKLPAGLLNNPAVSGISQEPFRLLVPLVSAAVNDKELPAAAVAALAKWLEQGNGGPRAGAVAPNPPVAAAR